MELCRSTKFIWAPVYSFTHWLRPRSFRPPPAFGLIYEGVIGQPRQTTSLCSPLEYALVIRSPRWQVPNSGAQEVDRAVAAARAAFPAWAARSGKLVISCLCKIS
jgi:hypothetical protein